jgi:hypothetical protein
VLLKHLLSSQVFQPNLNVPVSTAATTPEPQLDLVLQGGCASQGLLQLQCHHYCLLPTYPAVVIWMISLAGFQDSSSSRQLLAAVVVWQQQQLDPHQLPQLQK